MSSVFADAGYWMALLNPRDPLNGRALAVSAGLIQSRSGIITSEMVLAEVMNGLANKGPVLRGLAAQTCDTLNSDSNVTVAPQTRSQFRAALERYRSRSDKQWGLTDCASFLIMEERGLEEALTHDHHFVQAGFKALLRDD